VADATPILQRDWSDLPELALAESRAGGNASGKPFKASASFLALAQASGDVGGLLIFGTFVSLDTISPA
jgi:hypothetical protein